MAIEKKCGEKLMTELDNKLSNKAKEKLLRRLKIDS